MIGNASIYKNEILVPLIKRQVAENKWKPIKEYYWSNDIYAWIGNRGKLQIWIPGRWWLKYIR